MQNRWDDATGARATDAATVDARIEELTAKPVDADGVAAVAIGTAAWAVAGLVLVLFFRSELAADGNSWWLWVCLVGFGLGLIGLPYVIRRRAVYRQHAANSSEGPAPA